MALEPLVVKFTGVVGLDVLLMRLDQGGSLPGDGIVGCLEAWRTRRPERGETQRIAATLRAEIDVVLSGQTSLSKDDAEPVLLAATELLQCRGLSGSRLVAAVELGDPDDTAVD